MISSHWGLKSSDVRGRMSALSNYTLYGECIGMSKFDEIAELAIDNYGIVTAAEAVDWVNNFIAQIVQA